MSELLARLQDPATALSAAEQLHLLALEHKPEGAYHSAVCRTLGTIVASAYGPDVQQPRLLVAVLNVLLTWTCSADGRAAAVHDLPLAELARRVSDPAVLRQPLTSQLLQLLGNLATDARGRRQLQRVGIIPSLTKLLAAAASYRQTPPPGFAPAAAAVQAIMMGKTPSSCGVVSSDGGAPKVEACRAWLRLHEVLVGLLSNLLAAEGMQGSTSHQAQFVDAGGLEAACALLVQQGDNHAAASGPAGGSKVAVRLRMLLAVSAQQERWREPVQQALSAATAAAFMRWGTRSDGGGIPEAAALAGLSVDGAGSPWVLQLTESGVAPQPVLGAVRMALAPELAEAVLRHGQLNE